MNRANARFKTWTPAVPRKTPDNIVSSSYTTMKVFVPSYEKETRPRIEQLLTNDYQRIWWQEKQAWDKTMTARKISNKKILPRMMIKRKVPTCVTVKYQTRAERSRGRRKEDLKKRPSSEVEEQATFAKQNDDDTNKLKKQKETKLKKHEETKSEKDEGVELQKEHEETKSEKSAEIKSEKSEETKSEKSEETNTEKHEETEGEINEETKSEKSESTSRLEKQGETEEEKYEEAKSEKYEEIKNENFDGTKSEEREETQLKNNEDIKTEEED